jgi:hypothetical protein
MWHDHNYDLIERHKKKVRKLAEYIQRGNYQDIALGYESDYSERREAFDKLEFLEAIDYLVDSGYEFTNDAIAELVMDMVKVIYKRAFAQSLVDAK